MYGTTTRGDENRRLGTLLRDRRKLLGISRRHVAEKLGVTERTVADWEIRGVSEGGTATTAVKTFLAEFGSSPEDTHRVAICSIFRGLGRQARQELGLIGFGPDTAEKSRKDWQHNLKLGWVTPGDYATAMYHWRKGFKEKP